MSGYSVTDHARGNLVFKAAKGSHIGLILEMRALSGEKGIRTPDRAFGPITVYQTAAIDRSAISGELL